jgi:plastocyanin
MALARSCLVVVIGTTCFGLACGGGDGGTPPSPPRTAEKAPASGDNQTTNAGQSLAPFAVLVKESGSPKSGVSISWAVTVGGGTLSQGTSVTGVDGIATTVLTTGSDSVVQRVTATNATLSGSPLTFNATARIQGATQIALAPANSGNGQTDTVLTTLTNPYRVILRDEVSAPVQGVNVTWSVPIGQGSVSTAGSTSDGSGIATVSRTLGSTAGTQSAKASVRGLIGSPVPFTATATPGDAFQIAASGGAGSHAINSSFTYSVIARDKYDNTRSGVAVAWAVQAGTGSVNPTQNATGANGIATTTRTLGPNAGTYTDTASAAELQGSPVLFNVTAVTAPATAAVSVGDIFFRSTGNGTQNPAVDTITVGGTVTWSWVGVAQHNVESTGTQSFPSSAIKITGSYQFTFTAGGTYEYDCAVHGTAMTGRVVVVP